MYQHATTTIIQRQQSVSENLQLNSNIPISTAFNNAFSELSCPCVSISPSLNEIEYREGVLRQLTFDSNREKGFVSTFLKGFLKYKKQAPNLFWKDGETYGRYLIDADKELHKDISLAFEKSIEKLKRDYNDSVLEADA